MNTNLSIADREANLFQEWAKSKGEKNFIRDGAIDGEKYNESDLKIAFILKEHPSDKTGIDIRNDVSKYPYGWWRKLVKIVYGIRTRRENEKLSDAEMEKNLEDESDRSEKVQSICVFNLDKVGGNRSTDMVMLALIAMEDRCFIQQQFEIYSPDLTICGGHVTLDIFRHVLGHKGKIQTVKPLEIKNKKSKHDVRWYQWEQNGKKKFVLGTSHPAYSHLTNEFPKDVVNAVEKIMKNR